MKDREKFLSIGEAADLLGVSRGSLRKWSDRGLVRVHRTPGGQRRYSTADLRLFIESMREPGRGPSKPDRARRARRPASVS